MNEHEGNSNTPFPPRGEACFRQGDGLALDRYTHKDGKRLRLGFTTGTCAALAARAAARMFLSGRCETTTAIDTPKGIRIEAEVVDAHIGPGAASCAVRKDAGDDPDCTDGILVYATVSPVGDAGIIVDGGRGVGRVTMNGLDQPIGAAAINSVPRRMIAEAVSEVRDELGYAGGLRVEIAIPDGEAIAVRTFNPKLGIVGGLSIIGTSGIVEPMSDRAIVDTIAVEMRMVRADGIADLILTPGNYGESFIASQRDLAAQRYVKCSNYLGEALDLASELSFESVVVVGHIGKLIKVAGGVMNTHSRVADCRLDLLALHAGLAGADVDTMRLVMACPTVDAGLDVLDVRGLAEASLTGLLRRIDHYLTERVGNALSVGAVVFSNRSNLTRASDNALAILEEWNHNHEKR